MSNLLLDSLYQDFNISIKPVKPTKNIYVTNYANNIL